MNNLLLPLAETNSAELIAEYYTQADKIVKRAKSKKRPLYPRETKKLKELMLAVQRLDATVNPSTIMEAFKLLNLYISPIDHNFVCRLMDYEMAFLKDRFNLGKGKVED